MRLGVNWNTIVDIIEEFECKPSLEELFRNCESIKPRYYSLINKKIDSLEILLAEMSIEIDSVIKLGHVSWFINKLSGCGDLNQLSDSNGLNPSSDKGVLNSQKVKSNYHLQHFINVTFRPNLLTTQFGSTRIICFCTGTGIAPFISLYRNKKPEQHIILVYGYRNDEDDLSSYYDLECTIIRAKSSCGVYVTDFYHIIDESSHVFIFGNMKMQKEVFLKIKIEFPKIIDEKRIFFYNWQ